MLVGIFQGNQAGVWIGMGCFIVCLTITWRMHK